MKYRKMTSIKEIETSEIPENNFQVLIFPVVKYQMAVVTSIQVWISHWPACFSCVCVHVSVILFLLL